MFQLTKSIRLREYTFYNSKGEKEVIKNQSAYYKVVETNRDEDDKWYDVLGTANDLCGCVGEQWLSFYSVKNKSQDPILASSLLAVVDDSELPSGYETGIHMFEFDSVCNLNNPLYVWNDDTPEIYVYFQRDDDAKADVVGSIFSSKGYYAIAVVLGIGIDASGAVLVTKMIKRKKKEAQ